MLPFTCTIYIGTYEHLFVVSYCALFWGSFDGEFAEWKLVGRCFMNGLGYWCNTEGTVEPAYSPSPGCHFNEYSLISPDNVIKVILAAPKNQSSLDPWPTSLFKECTIDHADVSPVIAAVCNLSMSTGQIPSSLKEAYIMPLLKKPNIDKGDITNYRPISNLFLSSVEIRLIRIRIKISKKLELSF